MRDQLYIVEDDRGGLAVEVWKAGERLGLFPAPVDANRRAEYLAELEELNPGAIVDFVEGDEARDIWAEARLEEAAR